MFVFFFPVHFPRHIFIGDNFFSLLRRHTQNTDLCVIFGANTQVMAKTYARAWGGCARANGYRFESTATLGSNCNTNCQLKYEIQRACSATRKKRYFCTLRALSVSLGSWDVRVPAIAAAATPKLQSESITKMRLIQFYCLEVFSREHEDKKYTFDPKAEIARERARFCVRTDPQLLFLFLFEAIRRTCTSTIFHERNPLRIKYRHRVHATYGSVFQKLLSYRRGTDYGNSNNSFRFAAVKRNLDNIEWRRRCRRYWI